MESIVMKSNLVKTKYTFYLIGRILSYSGTIICILLAVLFTNFLFAIPGVIFGALSGYFTLASIKLKFAKNLLSALPENYHVFHNVKITVGGEQAQLDVVVVSQNGVSIIKVNNESGEIKGDINDDYWSQITTNENNYSYSTNIYSPIKQLETQGEIFNQYLKTYGINAKIDRYVYFSDEDTYVNIRNRHYSKTPIFSCKDLDKLIGYLIDPKNQNIMGKGLTMLVELLR